MRKILRNILMIFMTITVMLTLVSCGDKTGREADPQESGRNTGGEADRQESGRDTEEGTDRQESGQDTGGEASRENGLVPEDGNAEGLASSGENAGAQQTEMGEETIEWRNDYKDNFDVDEKAAAEFGRMIKEAVAQKDVEMLAELTGFPVYVGLKGGIVVETRDDFAALDVEELLSDEMVSSMASADENDLSPSMAGFTLYGSDGAPSITFGVRDGRLAISGINYGY